MTSGNQKNEERKRKTQKRDSGVLPESSQIQLLSSSPKNSLLHSNIVIQVSRQCSYKGNILVPELAIQSSSPVSNKGKRGKNKYLKMAPTSSRTTSDLIAFKKRKVNYRFNIHFKICPKCKWAPQEVYLKENCISLMLHYRCSCSTFEKGMCIWEL